MDKIEHSFEWVIDIIESCKTPFQLECAKTVIDLFEKKYNSPQHDDRLLSKLLELDTKLLLQ